MPLPEDKGVIIPYQKANAEREIDAGLDLKIEKVKEASFTNNWSENVPVFFTLIRYKKKFDRRRNFGDESRSLLAADLQQGGAIENPFVIEVVNASEIA